MDKITDQTINLNQNVADCLRTINNFGHQTIQNICTGKMTEVPWGSVDWVGVIVLISLGVIIGVLLIGALIFMFMSLFD